MVYCCFCGIKDRRFYQARPKKEKVSGQMWYFERSFSPLDSVEDIMQDIEIYIREPMIRRLIGWLTSELGELEEVTGAKAKAGVRSFRAVEQSPSIPIMINQAVDGSAYTGVWFNADNTPWASDAECARAAFAVFSLPVQCDPGAEHEGQDEFLRIDDKGERLVTLKNGQLGNT